MMLERKCAIKKNGTMGQPQRAPSSRQRAHPHFPENHRVWTNNMVIIPPSPNSMDLVPCDFALFPKLKMKLTDRCFETVSDTRRESQLVLDSIMENYFHCAFEAWKK
jgi:hypothetical protein